MNPNLGVRVESDERIDTTSIPPRQNCVAYCSCLRLAECAGPLIDLRAGVITGSALFEMEVEVAVQVHATTTPVATPAVLATLHLRAILSPQADMRIGGRPRELVAVRIHARNNDERDLLEQFLDRGIGPVTRCELMNEVQSGMRCGPLASVNPSVDPENSLRPISTTDLNAVDRTAFMRRADGDELHELRVVSR